MRLIGNRGISVKVYSGNMGYIVKYPDRLQVEHDFIEFSLDTIRNGGFVVVPAFAVARSQEILCVLERNAANLPRYLDGMGRDISRIFLDYQPYFRSFSLLSRAIKNTRYVQRRHRTKIIAKGGIVVTTAGMLVGGPVIDYMSLLYDDDKSGIALVGYQLPGTPGRRLLDEKKFYVDGKEVDVQANVKFFDFSSHIGATDLFSFISSVPARTEQLSLFCIHGEAASAETLADKASSELGHDAVAPSNGEIYIV
ncbi:MAG: MBL fold metallo-hydrolase RNA specificity domain-containing protein [Candidatus Ranarchaeia archaeon]